MSAICLQVPETIDDLPAPVDDSCVTDDEAILSTTGQTHKFNLLSGSVSIDDVRF